MAYVVRQFPVPKSLEELAEVVFRELQAVAEATEQTDQIILQVRHVAPAKMVPGMMVYADGANWDPGSGEGVYVRDKANAAWRYLG